MTVPMKTVPSRRLTRRQFGGALSLAPLLLASACSTPMPTPPAPPTRLRVKVFPGAQNLALFSALHKGFFAGQGLDVELLFTQNSVELRDDIANGSVQIAHSAVDNAVAMREVAGHDIVIFMGGDNSMNELFVQPDIGAVEQLRGKTLIVDAPDTAYALQAKKILLDKGLKPGDYQLKLVGGTFQRGKAMVDDRSNTASMLNPPFSLQARAAGMKSLGSVADLLGPYQASGAFAMRKWAAVNGDAIERYVAAYVQALRWATAPANREEAIALLADRLKLPPPMAQQTYAAIVNPRNGLATDARFDNAGFANVLRLRAELESKGGTAPALPPARYVDLGWYERGMRRVK